MGEDQEISIENLLDSGTLHPRGFKSTSHLHGFSLAFVLGTCFRMDPSKILLSPCNLETKLGWWMRMIDQNHTTAAIADAPARGGRHLSTDNI